MADNIKQIKVGSTNYNVYDKNVEIDTSTTNKVIIDIHDKSVTFSLDGTTLTITVA